MDISPAQIIKDYGLSVVGKASGIPLGTLSRWAKANKVPGRGVSRAMRETQLRTAIANLEANGVEKKPAPKAKRARAA